MIHDRVRDNLTIVLALLELQLKNEIEKPTSELLKDSHARIRSMALIHETMVQSESISEVNMKNFTIKLSNRLQKSFQNAQQDLEVSMNADEVLMHIDRAVPTAMILNELMVNAFTHGFADLTKGVIFVHFRKKGNNLYFKIRNNGHPLPSNFETITKRTLGYKLIKTLIKQLGGEFKIVDYKEPAIEVVVPLKQG
jgi:two-component sensor histidine kinase